MGLFWNGLFQVDFILGDLAVCLYGQVGFAIRRDSPPFVGKGFLGFRSLHQLYYDHQISVGLNIP